MNEDEICTNQQYLDAFIFISFNVDLEILCVIIIEAFIAWKDMDSLSSCIRFRHCMFEGTACSDPFPIHICYSLCKHV